MHPLVITALSAVRKQDWARAAALLDAAEAEPLDDDSRAELLSVRAAARRRQGELNAARSDYAKLAELVGEADPRRVEAYEGLAECYLTAGAVRLATQLIERALDLPAGKQALRVRCETIYARCLARSDLSAARQRMEELFQTPLPDGSARANARFYYGDVLLALGDCAGARQQYGVAHAEAEVFGAPKTAADCLRREATLRLALDEREGIAEALEMLREAEELYARIGDRALCMVHTERGEILKHTGVYRRSHSELRRATVLAREGHEHLRIAHGLLGQADLFRVTKTWRRCLALLTEAERIYRQLDHAWGLLMCAAVDALLQREVGNADAAAAAVGRARTLVQRRQSALGVADLGLIERLDELPSGDPLLLVYPD